MLLWRISNHESLAGDGGLRASGRWHTRGRRVLYCSESAAAALLETLVHFELDVRDLPVGYRLLEIHAPDDISIERVTPEQLVSGWPDRIASTRALGDQWLRERQAALLRAPSAVVPATFNILLNPAHPDARRVRLARVSAHLLDPRLL